MSQQCALNRLALCRSFSQLLPLSPSASSLASELICSSRWFWLVLLVCVESGGPEAPAFFCGPCATARRFLDGEVFTISERRMIRKLMIGNSCWLVCFGTRSQVVIVSDVLPCTLTHGLPEDNIAHELFKSLCVETRSMHRHSILERDRTGQVVNL